MPDILDYWLREYRFRHRLLAQERREGQSLRHRCSYCRESSEARLLRCSVCKAVRYCDRSCQTNHYRSSHKKVCKNLRQVPITAFFMTQPVLHKWYPPHPLIGHATEEDLAMWVSIDGSMDAELRPLIFPMRPPSGPYEVEERRRKGRENPRTTKQYRAYDPNLLTLEILVQNRGQASEFAVVFAARTFIQCMPSDTDKVMFGCLGAVDHCIVDESTGIVRCGPAYDPFTNRPRLFIKNFNGHEIRDDAFMPPAVLNAEEGIIMLGRGDFVIFQMQFRLADGILFRREFEALSFVDNLFLPVSCRKALILASDRTKMRALAEDFNDDMKTEFLGPGRLPVEGLYAGISHDEIGEHYIEFCGAGRQEGRRAFASSHFGEEEAERWERIRRTVVPGN